VRRRSLDLVDQAEDVRDGERAQAIRQRSAFPPGARERVEHPIEGAALTEVEEFVLALEIVIEVAGGEVGGRRDVAHAGRGETHRPERLGGRSEDLDAAGVGPK